INDSSSSKTLISPFLWSALRTFAPFISEIESSSSTSQLLQCIPETLIVFSILFHLNFCTINFFLIWNLAGCINRFQRIMQTYKQEDNACNPEINAYVCKKCCCPSKSEPHKPHRLAYWAGCHKQPRQCACKSCFAGFLIFCF